MKSKVEAPSQFFLLGKFQQDSFGSSAVWRWWSPIHVWSLLIYRWIIVHSRRGSSVFGQTDDTDDGSLNLAFDDYCPSDQTVVGKGRVKSRDTVCSVKSPSVYLPDNFRDLDEALQKTIFEQFMCPTSDPRFITPYIPVCSSRLSEDTRQAGLSEIEIFAPSGRSAFYYTLQNSFLSGLSCSDPSFYGFLKQQTLAWRIIVSWTDTFRCAYRRRPFCCFAWAQDIALSDDDSSRTVKLFLNLLIDFCESQRLSFWQRKLLGRDLFATKWLRLGRFSEFFCTSYASFGSGFGISG